MRPLDAVTKWLGKMNLRKNPEGWLGTCPVCAHPLQVGESPGGSVFLRCTITCCPIEDIVARMGMNMSDLLVFDSQLSQLSQTVATPATVSSHRKQSQNRNSRNFRNVSRQIADMLDEEVDQLPIIPPRPESAPWPETPLDQFIDAVHDRTQAPKELCGQSILAALALCTQHLADIEMPGIGGKAAKRPISCYFLSIAKSGERKSTVDGVVLDYVEQHITALEKLYAENMAEYNNRMELFRRDELSVEPVEPREPIFLVKDPTQEGLFRSLLKGELSAGLFSDEGGSFIGGYGMSKDNRMRTAATFNQLWGGSKIDRPRAKEHEVIRGRRFSVHLMIQPQASQEIVGDGMLKDLGFTARCLISEPESTIGNRPFHRPAQASLDLCEMFGGLLAQCLAIQPVDPCSDMGLELKPLRLSEASEDLWISFYNEIEGNLLGAYSTIQGFAGKVPEHAIRLAGVLTLAFVDQYATQIKAKCMQMGIALSRYYLSQQMRLEAGRGSELDESAQLLMDWLLSNKWKCDYTSIADICRSGPNSIRKRDAATKAVEICVETGHLIALTEGAEVNGKKRRQALGIVARLEKAATVATVELEA